VVTADKRGVKNLYLGEERGKKESPKKEGGREGIIKTN